MELRELKYFLAVAREQNISKAAEYLYITQPSLSRQMQNLEAEIGKPLFVRGSKRITLTDAGVLLRKRAEELIELYEKTESEVKAQDEVVGGDIHIGGGESFAMSEIAEAAKEFQELYPLVKFHIYSGDTLEVMEKLDKGLIDFGLLVEPADLTKYEYLKLRQKDSWGVLMRADCALAKKEFVEPGDLYDKPLILSRHALENGDIVQWFKKDISTLNVVATFNLIYNASLLVAEGLGYAMGIDKLINCTDSSLVFRPFKPRLETALSVAWKRYQVFSKPCEKFLEILKKRLG